MPKQVFGRPAPRASVRMHPISRAHFANIWNQHWADMTRTRVPRPPLLPGHFLDLDALDPISWLPVALWIARAKL